MPYWDYDAEPWRQWMQYRPAEPETQPQPQQWGWPDFWRTIAQPFLSGAGIPTGEAWRGISGILTGMQQPAYWAERAYGELATRIPHEYLSAYMRAGMPVAQALVETPPEISESLRLMRNEWTRLRGGQPDTETVVRNSWDDLHNFFGLLPPEDAEWTRHQTSRIVYRGPESMLKAAQQLNDPAAYEGVEFRDPERVTQILNEQPGLIKEMALQAAFDPLNALGATMEGIRLSRRADDLRAMHTGVRTSGLLDELAGKFAKADVPFVSWLLRETNWSKAERLKVNSLDYMANALVGVADGPAAKAVLETWRTDPVGLSQTFGKFITGPEYGDDIIKVLDQVDLGKLKSLKAEMFNLADFILELEDGVRDASRAIYAPEKDLLHLPDLFKSFKSYASDLYLTTPGYQWRNAWGNFIPAAADGAISFERAEDIATFYQKLGFEPARLKEGIGAAGFIRGKKPPLLWKPMAAIGEKSRNVAQKIESAFRLRASYTGTKKHLRTFWRFGADIPDLPPQVPEEVAENIRRGIQHGLGVDDFKSVIARAFGDVPDVNVAKYLDDLDDVSPELVSKVQSALDEFGPGPMFDDFVDTLAQELQSRGMRAHMVDGHAWDFEKAEYIKTATGSWRPPWEIDDYTRWSHYDSMGEMAARLRQGGIPPREFKLPTPNDRTFGKAWAKAMEAVGLPPETTWGELRNLESLQDMWRAKLTYNNEIVKLAERIGVDISDLSRVLTEAEAFPRIGGIPLEPVGAPLMSDAVDAATQAEMAFLDRAKAGVIGEAGSYKAPPELQKILNQWLNKELLPAWRDSRLVAVKAGEATADFALLNYSNRRNLDTLISLGYPYHYWYTRSGKNYATRMFTKPYLFTNYLRFRKVMEDINKERPARLQRQVPIPAGEALKPWMGENLYANLERLMFPWLNIYPWAEVTKPAWDDPEEATNAIGKIWQMQQAFQMRPYVFYELPATLMGARGEREKQEYGYMTPWTGAIRGGTALAREYGLGPEIPPGGVNIEAELRERFGMPRSTYYEEYYWPVQHLANMVAKGEMSEEEAWEAVGAHFTREEQSDDWDTAYQRAAVQRGFSYAGSFLTGAPLNIYPVGEEANRLAQKMLKQLGYDYYERPQGSKQERTEFIKGHPGLPLRWLGFDIAEEGPPAMEREYRDHIAWQNYNQWRTDYQEQIDAYILQNPGDTKGLREFKEQLNEGRPEVSSSKTATGMNPEEWAQFQGEEFLRTILETFPDAEDYRIDETINWDAYYARREEWFQQVEDGSLPRIQGLIELAGMGFGGIELPAEQVTLATGLLPAEDSKEFISRLIGGREGVERHWRRNDSPLEAAQRIYKDTVIDDAYRARDAAYGPWNAWKEAREAAGYDIEEISGLWDYYHTLPSGTGERSAFLRAYPELLEYQEFKEKYQEEHPEAIWENVEATVAGVGFGPVDAVRLIPQILKVYKERGWTEEELEEELEGLTFPGFATYREMQRREPGAAQREAPTAPGVAAPPAVGREEMRPEFERAQEMIRRGWVWNEHFGFYHPRIPRRQLTSWGGGKRKRKGRGGWWDRSVLGRGFTWRV